MPEQAAAPEQPVVPEQEAAVKQAAVTDETVVTEEAVVAVEAPAAAFPGMPETEAAVQEAAGKTASLGLMPAAPPRSHQMLVDEQSELLRHRRNAMFDAYSGRAKRELTLPRPAGRALSPGARCRHPRRA